MRSILPKFAGFLKSVRLQTPKKAPVLIFDPEGSDDLINLVLPGIPYSVLPVRNELFYLSPVVLLKMMRNFRYRAFISGKNAISLLYQSYIFSVTEYIQPSVVITYIDNNHTFQWLSRNYTDARFFAIQNGVRNKYDLHDSLINSDGTIKTISMPNFVCYGQNDVDNYTRFGHSIDHFYPKGSLRGSYYRYSTPGGSEKNTFEICLVSQYRQEIFNGSSLPGFKEASVDFFRFLKLFLETHRCRACIALCSSSEEEKDYYSDLFGDLVTITSRSPDDYLSTYRAMDHSEVSVTVSSGAALEAFGWGKKVLFCNYFGDFEIADLYLTGICSTTQKDYESFEKALSLLLSMDYDEFTQKTRESQKYMMAYDPDQPVHEFLRKIIVDSITPKDG
jgi:surface carbohydrate biosynthesis protein